MASNLYQWQTVRKVGCHYPIHDPDEVHPVQPGKQRVAPYAELVGQRPKDIDIGQTAWRLRRVAS